MTTELPSIEEFELEATTWLDKTVARRPTDDEARWGVGSDCVALFRNLSLTEEREHIDRVRAWQHTKSEAGWGSIAWEKRYGGRDLPPSYAAAFADLESGFDIPPFHEAVGITMELVAPTIRAVGTEDQKRRFIRRMRRTDDLWCQLFSEPAAGSDLAGVTTRATRDGDEWVLEGQKVWTSGAQYADYGYILCRTDPDQPKHKGMTAFIMPMDAPGVEVRPLRQMTGGSSFNEVFLTEVRLDDALRLGEVGSGWQVALTTLSFERNVSSQTGTAIGWQRLAGLVGHLGLADDPVVRQGLGELIALLRIQEITRERTNERLRVGQTPGPEGSLGKLMWTETLRRLAAFVSDVLGPTLVADTGEWGTFAWSELVCGVPGIRIAAGSDEIQRNIIGELVLGLPGEPRADRGPFASIPR